jgi:hypothetical protein
MAVDARKRQKKLERQRAKKKAERRELARLSAGGLPARLREASAAPVLHCGTTASIWDKGIGQVLISRHLPDGRVAFVVFLVDRYCLGVKDVIMNVAPRAEYQSNLYEKIKVHSPFLPMKPECVRKLVESAVRYADDLGIAPYPDYRIAKTIFGDIPAEACAEEYEFGKDGRPYFFAGPYDTPARCREIMGLLEDRCGPGGYHFVVPAGPAWE